MYRRRGIVLAVFITASIFIIMNILKVKEESRLYEVGSKLVNNPDRGFYVQADVGEKEKIEKYREQVRLFLLAFDLYEYRNQEIPKEKLGELSSFLEEARQKNVKCIFRAAYGFDEEESNDADCLERIEEHISQIAPILNQYKNQICCVQAGFFGPWGEWHSSKYLKEEEEGKKNRNWLLQELLEQLAEGIIIDVRRPRFIRDGQEAGFDMERIGFQNDGLLGTESDYGTYDDPEYSRAEEMEWMESNLKTGINGGEMPQVNKYSEASNAVAEFSKMKISYLNLKYNEEVYEQWKNQKVEEENAFAYIEKRLGYRFFISKVQYPVSLKKGILGRNQKIEIVLKNEGFAPIGKNYELEWVVEDWYGKLHYFKENQSLETVGAGESISIGIKAKTLKKIQAKKVGIRISRIDDKEKYPENCVELVNDEILYERGVNFIISVEEEGEVDAR